MPKIRGTSLSEHREQTRTRIFEAFARLLQRMPYDAITLADIAAEADVGRTAMYNHFPDKEAVVLAFATDETSQYLERLEDALEQTSSPVEAFRTYVRQHWEMSQEFHLGLGPALYGMLSPESLGEIRKHVRLVERVVRDILHRGMSDNLFVSQDVDAAVALIHAALQVRGRGIDVADIEAFLLRALGVSEHDFG